MRDPKSLQYLRSFTPGEELTGSGKPPEVCSVGGGGGEGNSGLNWSQRGYASLCLSGAERELADAVSIEEKEPV